jgi:4-amino-4-deoxy-L-arabinose transferase-like glycosyltransferase
LSTRIFALLVLLLIGGAILRVEVDHVDEYSPDDEAVYVRTTQFLHEHGWSSYPSLVRSYVADRNAWLYPHPMRWGYFALSTLTCAVAPKCDARALAGLSTAAGIVSILLVFLIGRELLGDEVALIAAALTATSPLQLVVGRRALEDEVFCAAILLSLWLGCLVVRANDGSDRRHRSWLVAAAVVSMTLTLGIKESFLLIYPAVLVFLLALSPPPRLRTLRRIAALVVLPPLLYALVTIVLSGGVKRYRELLHIVMTAASSANTPFAQQFSSGPFHRPLFDLVILSPIVIVLAVAGAARSGGDRALVALTAFAVVVLIVFGLLPLKNVRYVIELDPVSRLLAASAIASLPRRPWMAIAVVGLVAATELQVFHELLAADLYDPVTDELLRALHAIP